MKKFHVLVLPPDPNDLPELCSDPTQSTLPEWIEGELRTDKAHYEPLGKRMGIWWERNGVGARNERALALWYAVIGSDTGKAAPVPPGFLGPVVVEADNGQLTHRRLLSFLDSKAARSFRYSGGTPEPGTIRDLIKAWNTAA